MLNASRKRPQPSSVAADQLRRLPNVLVLLVGEFLRYREVVQLAGASSGLRADLRNVPVWEHVSITQLMKHPTAMGSFRSAWVYRVEQLAHLPASVRHLYCMFNQSIDDVQLPSSITHLRFGFYFNQPIEKVQLPSSLTVLTFGFSFNQPIEELALPSSLTCLMLGNYYRRPIEKLARPSSLRVLWVGGGQRQAVVSSATE